MSRLQGKTAIVTGGARGMGEATVRGLVAQGAKVVIADVLEDEGVALAAELGDVASFVKMDVTSKADWAVAVAEAEKLGSLNVLVNNAAILLHKTIMETTEEDFMKVATVNQLGTFLGMQSVFEAMKANGGGSIINVSSIDGIQSKNSLCAYSASKWAVRGMTKSAAVEMGKYGIRVNSVHPGGIYTAMHGSEFISVEQANEFYPTHPLPRVGLPHEVANVTIFLASDEATYSTGAEFIADGGWSAGLVNPALPQL
ncbi:3-alpha-(or 20-beta)-hydroxysteroid dehydrogenase [Sinobacterium norvegicum]|uniref:3-alpha-(Or 20-beta)-hydroxysteroid dehydrogenase n=1 Tax=Sinobacterium norvegicum TaxID=1641715 RepID=A0ABM9AES5_9GAMM|nr:glucose 1-dehydrogenase [Sinobacterium norvegicum]CAH0991208.1 3-alpha-(or 20-beta)-hydroxysteroid dehydrogenase [Sinobacterium norvegicum]